MNRRRLLRMALGAGGGSLALPLASCDDVASSAVRGWRGPSADVTDPRLRALAWAMLAPSPHNTQPWLADLRRADRIMLHVDLARRLPVTDPLGRQTLIGQGTFVEALVLAARGEGWAAEVTSFPEGPFAADSLDARPVAQAQLRPADPIVADPLLGVLTRRRSSKLAFDPEKPVRPEHQAALRAVIADMPVALGVADQPERVAAIREVVRAALRAEQASPPALAETVRWLRLCADSVAMHPDGQPVTGVLPWWMRRLGLLSPEQLAQPRSIAWRSGQTIWDNILTGSPSFGWLATPDDSRMAQLQAGRAYMRVDLSAALAGVAIHPVSQALADLPAMAEHRAELDRLLGIQAPARVQMLFRLGYAGPQAAAPRRPVEAILRA